MLDLIIPSYKDKRGLFSSLFSVGLNENISITIVDDCSGEKYDDIINTFSPFFPIRVIYTPKNGGPGVARQYGFDNTFNPYVIFLDCGDNFTTPLQVKFMLEEIMNHPEAGMISYAHLEEKFGGIEFAASGNNRMHGKIYSREFLQKYNIRFNTETPRCNEDIGFNMNCRLIGEHIFNTEDREVIFENGDTAVIWRNTKNSITRSNDCAFYYKEQNNGLAHGVLAAMKNAQENGVDEELIISLGHDVFCSLYFFYLSTLNRRPEFAEESFDGAYYFYKNFFADGQIDIDLLRNYYYNGLAGFLADPEDPIKDALNPYTIYNFITDLQKRYENEVLNDE